MKAAQQPTGRWVPCDSRSALIAQKSKNACEQLITESPNSWGYMAFESGTIIPIGYADMGLLPVAVMHGNKIFVGVDELIAAYNWPSNTRHFKYKMPTVFHEFVRFDRDELIVRDEIGFVGISYDGDEHWKFCVDTIASYEIKEMIIFGETEEGQVFKFTIPSTKSPPPLHRQLGCSNRVMKKRIQAPYGRIKFPRGQIRGTTLRQTAEKPL